MVCLGNMCMATLHKGEEEEEEEDDYDDNNNNSSNNISKNKVDLNPEFKQIGACCYVLTLVRAGRNNLLFTRIIDVPLCPTHM